jgi:hypothetical protein
MAKLLIHQPAEILLNHAQFLRTQLLCWCLFVLPTIRSLGFHALQGARRIVCSTRRARVSVARVQTENLRLASRKAVKSIYRFALRASINSTSQSRLSGGSCWRVDFGSLLAEFKQLSPSSELLSPSSGRYEQKRQFCPTPASVLYRIFHLE